MGTWQPDDTCRSKPKPPASEQTPEIGKTSSAAPEPSTAPMPPVYPQILSTEPKIVLDRISDSMFYLWFPHTLAYDMILIKIQKAAREIEWTSQERIKVDIGYIQQGRVVLRVNLAEPDDGGEGLKAAVTAICKVICTTTDAKTRSSFLSEMYPYNSER